jgi:1-acyl-sn-glycerol-3-phosphate acyltransferase
MYNIVIDIILRILDIDIEIIRKSNVIHPIITSNHISEFDPVLLFYVLRNPKIRYIAAGVDVIKKIPLINAICESLDVIFIEQHKQLANDTLVRQIKPTDTVCIFPEGTLLFKSSIERSDLYCEKIGISKFKNVLAPRETGFSKIREILKCDKYTDITIIYDVDTRQSTEPLTLLELIRIRPKKVKIIIDETEISITDTFRNKDELIETIRRDAEN